jgi:serine/threonine protein kinase
MATSLNAVGEWAKRTSTSMRDSLDYVDDVEEEEPRVQLPVSQRPKGRYGLTDFIIHRTLGTGSFGRVHLGACLTLRLVSNLVSDCGLIYTVRSKHNLRFYAIKVLSKEKVVRTKQVQHTNNEREMLEAVQHPFIVNLWGTFQDSSNLYMVMDFVAGGELFTLLRRSNVRCPRSHFRK